MDNLFTSKVQAWLDTPAAERDNAQGALFLLQLSNNQIMYRYLSAAPDKRAEFIEYQIRKYMKFRLASLTHEQVVQMQRQVRELSVENANCPDSERYQFLKELIALDKQYHANWHFYDSYSTEAAAQGAEQSLIEFARQAEKTVCRQINLTKGRYKKNPSDKLKAQIVELMRMLWLREGTCYLLFLCFRFSLSISS